MPPAKFSKPSHNLTPPSRLVASPLRSSGSHSQATAPAGRGESAPSIPPRSAPSPPATSDPPPRGTPPLAGPSRGTPSQGTPAVTTKASASVQASGQSQSSASARLASARRRVRSMGGAYSSSSSSASASSLADSPPQGGDSSPRGGDSPPRGGDLPPSETSSAPPFVQASPSRGCSATKSRARTPLPPEEGGPDPAGDPARLRFQPLVRALDFEVRRETDDDRRIPSSSPRSPSSHGDDSTSGRNRFEPLTAEE
eukprot:146407-Prorocentrum_minimum.AAC.1